MKDVDSIPCYIDPFLNKYLVVAFIMLDKKFLQCLFAYTFDVFKIVSRLLWFFTIPPFAFLYHVLLFIAYRPLPLCRVLSFHLKTLRDYPSTQLLIHLALSQYFSPMVQLTTISRKRVYYIIMLLLISLLVLVFGSLLFPIFITIFIDFIIFALLYLLSFPTLNLAPIVLLAFLMNTNLVIILTTVII